MDSLDRRSVERIAQAIWLQECFDELPVQLLDKVVEPLPMKMGKSALSRICLSRRIGSIEELDRQIQMIVKERNE